MKFGEVTLSGLGKIYLSNLLMATLKPICDEAECKEAERIWSCNECQRCIRDTVAEVQGMMGLRDIPVEKFTEALGTGMMSLMGDPTLADIELGAAFPD